MASKRARTLDEVSPRTLAKRVKAARPHVEDASPRASRASPKIKSDDPTVLCPAIESPGACRAAPECAYVPSYGACMSRRAAAGVSWLPSIWGHSKEALEELRRLNRAHYGYSDRLTTLAMGVGKSLLDSVARGFERALAEYSSKDSNRIFGVPATLLVDLVIGALGSVAGLSFAVRTDSKGSALNASALGWVAALMAGRAIDKVRGSMFEEAQTWVEMTLETAGLSKAFAPLLSFVLVLVLQFVLLMQVALNLSAWASPPAWIAATIHLYMGVTPGDAVSTVGAIWAAASLMYRTASTLGMGVDLRELLTTLRQPNLLKSVWAVIKHVGFPVGMLWSNPTAAGFLTIVRLAEAVARGFFRAAKGSL